MAQDLENTILREKYDALPWNWELLALYLR